MIFFPETQDQADFLLAWASRILDGADFGPCHCMAVIVDDRLCAVAVYHNYRDGTIELSFAANSVRWATRGAISAVISYPFKCLDVRRLSAITRKKNRRVRKLLAGVGFLLEGQLHAAFCDGDGCMYAMTRRYFERSRWNNGKKLPVAAARA